MRKKILSILIIASTVAKSQVADLHNHITNKHFISDLVMPEKLIKYVNESGKLPAEYLRNWEQMRKVKQMKKGDSNYGNYFQSTYTDLQLGNYKMVVQSISPLETNLFHDPDFFFRNFVRFAEPKVSKMPRKSFTTLINTSPWKEAYAEFLYTVHQAEQSPAGNFKMYFPKNADSLRIHAKDPNTCLGIISFEGGHILFGDSVFGHREFMRPTLSPEGKKEVIENVKFLKEQCEYHTFFITPVHVYWNTFGGQAKALDKLEFRTVLEKLFWSVGLRKKLATKFGSGLPPVINKQSTGRPDTSTCNCSSGYRIDNNCYKFPPVIDHFGAEVICKLLDPKKSTPIYIDVKHMDVRSRYDYYILHDSLEKVWNIKIPIIYSHGAVSGEKLKVAYYTSVSPMMDRYEEVDDPKKFYQNLLNPEYLAYNCGLKNDYHVTNEKGQVIDAKITPADLKLTNSLEDSTTVGWFYPWSINLYDEEISKIYESDGIIGVMTEERTLGWNLPNYQKNKLYKDSLTKSLIRESFLSPKYHKEDLDSFRIAECFLRNVFYIIRHSGRSDSAAWNNIALGSDFDGFINPIDICLTSADVENFKQYLIRVIPSFLNIHKEYQLENSYKNLLFNLTPKRAMEKLFFENTDAFVKKYFDQRIPLNH